MSIVSAAVDRVASSTFLWHRNGRGKGMSGDLEGDPLCGGEDGQRGGGRRWWHSVRLRRALGSGVARASRDRVDIRSGVVGAGTNNLPAAALSAPLKYSSRSTPPKASLLLPRTTASSSPINPPQGAPSTGAHRDREQYCSQFCIVTGNGVRQGEAHLHDVVPIYRRQQGCRVDRQVERHHAPLQHTAIVLEEVQDPASQPDGHQHLDQG